MRKIFITTVIALFAISIVNAQSPRFTSPANKKWAASVDTSIVQLKDGGIGTNLGDSLAVHLDTLKRHRTDIDEAESDLTATAATTVSTIYNVESLEGRVSGVTGWTIGLNATGDSMQFSSSIGTYVVAFGASDEADNTPPYSLSFIVNNTERTKIIGTFSENLIEDSITSTSFDISTSGGDQEAVISSLSITNSIITFTLDSAILTGENIFIDYNVPTSLKVQDVSNNLLLASSNYVTNNVTTASTIMGYWLFEDNLVNEDPTSTITITTHENYEVDYLVASESPPEGFYAIDFGGSESLKSTAPVTFSNEWTISSIINHGGSSDHKSLFMIDDYLKVWIDYANDDIEIQTLQGSVQTGKSTTQVLDWNAHHIAIRYKYNAANSTYYMTIWNDGVLVSNDSTVGDCSAMSDTFRVAYNHDSQRGNIDEFDALHIYSSALSSNQIASLYADPSSPIGGEPGDVSVVDPITEYTLLEYNGFENIGLKTRARFINKTSTAGYDPDDDTEWNAAWSDDNNRDIYNMAIEDWQGDRVLAMYYDEGHCGASGNDDYYYMSANGGNDDGHHTGMYFTAYFDEAETGYDDVYFSYNVRFEPGFYTGSSTTPYQEMKIPGISTSSTVTENWGKNRFRLFNYGDDGSPTDNYFTWLTTAQGVNYHNVLVSKTASAKPDDGEWHNMCMRMTMNTDGNSDGIREVFYDGVLVDSQQKFKWAVDITENINKMRISTQAGSWNLAQVMESDGVIYYDDFCAWTSNPTGNYPGQSEKSETGRTLINAPSEAHIFDKNTGEIYFAAVGNSTWVRPPTWVGNDPGYIADVLSVEGNSIETQTNVWNAHSSAEKLKYDYVVIQVGLNDMGQSTRDYAFIVDKYETLLQAIADDTKPECKVIHFTTTQIKNHEYWVESWSTKQDLVNAWILSNTTNVDLTSNANWADLDDPANPDSMNPIYIGSGVHPNDAGYLLLEQNIKDAIQSLE